MNFIVAISSGTALWTHGCVAFVDLNSFVDQTFIDSMIVPVGG